MLVGAATEGALGGMKAVRMWRRDVWDPAQVRRDRLAREQRRRGVRRDSRFCKFIIFIDMVCLMLPT